MLIPLDFVESLYTEGFIDTTHIGVAPRSDSLGELYYGVFEYNEKFYRCQYTEGNSYWKSEMGTWEDPFDVVYDGGIREYFVECEEVQRVEKFVLVTSYEPT